MESKDLVSPLTPAMIPSEPRAISEPLPSTDTRKPRLQRSKKTVERLSGMYDQIGMSLALLLAFSISIALWVAGAFFTLQFLGAMGIALASAGILAWLIPAAITASELWLWPNAGTRWQQVLFFFLVLAFDIGSSWAGLIEWGADRYIPLFSGFTIPAGGWQLHSLAVILGLILAFAPEKLGRWALSELWRIWH